jgi:hypothetical protein
MIIQVKTKDEIIHEKCSEYENNGRRSVRHKQLEENRGSDVHAG